jgi:excisionase family DNA binding protein
VSATTTEGKAEKEPAFKEPVNGQLLYSVDQAARILGLSPRLLWTFVASNQLKTRRCGTRVLIHRRELEKFALHDHATSGEDKTS